MRKLYAKVVIGRRSFSAGSLKVRAISVDDILVIVGDSVGASCTSGFVAPPLVEHCLERVDLASGEEVGVRLKPLECQAALGVRSKGPLKA